MPSSWWRGSSGAITGRICRTEGVVKQRAKARVLDNLYYDNIFCSLNFFFFLLSTVLIEGAWSREPEAVFLRAPRFPSHALPGVDSTPAP